MPAPKAAPAKATAAGPKVTATPAAVDWDSLDDAQVVDYTRATVETKDLEASTPAPIKSRVVAAFESTQRAGKVQFFNQVCPNPDAALAFIKFGKEYAKSKGYTFRGSQVSDSTLNKLVQMQRVAPLTASGCVVTYSVKPAETRQRLDEATKKQIIKDVRSTAKTERHARIKELAERYKSSPQTLRKWVTDAGIDLPVLTRGRKAAAK